MNEIIYYMVDRDNLCETNYFNGITDVLNNYLTEYSIVVTANYNTLPVTKYKKIVILGGDEGGVAGLNLYSQYPDVVVVFRFYNTIERYDNKYIFPIPIGYNCRSNGEIMVKMYPEKKISDRKYDVFYSGQVLEWRKPLVDALEQLSKTFNIYSQPTSGFRQGLCIDDYYKTMGDTKICVCPDGTAVDTFRFVEACGSGCVVITTLKPDLWYYHNAPVYYINSWGELTRQFLENILTSDLDTLQTNINKYYTECLSEEAVANYIIETIRSKQ